MNEQLRKGLITGGVILGVVLLGLFVSALRDAQGEDLTKLLGVSQKLNTQVPMDVQLVDEEGQKRELKTFFEPKKPVALFFVFYKCRSACVQEFDGAVTTFRKILNKTIGKDYTVLTVSIHPKETAELAKSVKPNYLDIYNRPGSEKGWHFLTGDYDNVMRLAGAVGFKYTYDEKKDRVIHPTCLILLTPTGRVSKYYTGTSYPATLVNDSLVMAQNEQIGRPEEAVNFAGCFTYDPATGRTFIQVDRAIKLTALITVLAISISIIGMLRKEKQALRQQEAAASIDNDTKESER